MKPRLLVYDLAAACRPYLSTNVSLPCIRIPEHQVYTYDDSESPRGQRAQPDPGPPDAVSLLNESPQRPNQRAKGDAELRPKVPDEQEEQLKLSRCLSDPGPNKEEEEDGSFRSWWSTYLQFLTSSCYLLYPVSEWEPWQSLIFMNLNCWKYRCFPCSVFVIWDYANCSCFSTILDMFFCLFVCLFVCLFLSCNTLPKHAPLAICCFRILSKPVASQVSTFCVLTSRLESNCTKK